MSSSFNYNNTDTIIKGGSKKIVRKVSIKNGKGYKSITKYHKGKKVSFVKKISHYFRVMVFLFLAIDKEKNICIKNDGLLNIYNVSALFNNKQL